eukprot:SAG31_NODE_7754_length_1603_cov_1.092420_1_plen_64_part_10
MLLIVALGPAPVQGAAALELDVAPGGGSFSISLDGVAWLQSAPAFLRANNVSHSSSSTLRLERF